MLIALQSASHDYLPTNEDLFTRKSALKGWVWDNFLFQDAMKRRQLYIPLPTLKAVSGSCGNWSQRVRPTISRGL
ncbi:hypothetical protein ADS46_18265 [Halomonas sp. G11]|nr:hypothetical protein ADS46_18265 [Halomonas sp. G11]